MTKVSSKSGSQALEYSLSHYGALPSWAGCREQGEVGVELSCLEDGQQGTHYITAWVPKKMATQSKVFQQGSKMDLCRGTANQADHMLLLVVTPRAKGGALCLRAQSHILTWSVTVDDQKVTVST